MTGRCYVLPFHPLRCRPPACMRDWYENSQRPPICHSERSEESLSITDHFNYEILRYAQDDNWCVC